MSSIAVTKVLKKAVARGGKGDASGVRSGERGLSLVQFVRVGVGVHFL